MFPSMKVVREIKFTQLKIMLAPSIINNGNGDINNELNNESETVFNDGKNNESSTGINKEMNKTSTELCIE